MKRFTILLLASLLSFAASPTFGQEAESNGADQQAAALEGELGKHLDTSPEAGDVMVELANLYHQHGRVFGLIRVAQKFTAAHPADPRHRQMMLKLIDGLQVMSRNKDLAVACRQFLDRYPDASECAEIERRLVFAEDELDEPSRAADARRAVWTRSPQTKEGRRHGAEAVKLYASLNNAAHYRSAAELAEEMLSKLPAGDVATEAGWQAMHHWRRVSQWTDSNRAALAMLKKSPPTRPARLQETHRIVAENYRYLNQHANSAASYAKARQVKDDPSLHMAQLQQLHSAAAKPSELAPLVKEYYRRYPDHDDRYVAMSLQAFAFSREKDNARAREIFGALLPYDADANSAASYYVRYSEEAQWPETEKALREAIAKNEKDAAYLRYVLGFELYRDRLKDPDKARQTLHELISKSPSNDSYTRYAVNWLLSSPETQEQFESEVKKIVAAWKDNLHLREFRDAPGRWQQSAKRNKETKDRAAYLQQALQEAIVLVKLWEEADDWRNGNGATARQQLIEKTGSLADEPFRRLYEGQGYYYRRYSSRDERSKSIDYYQKLARRFSEEVDAAREWLEAATDYGQPQQAKQAAEHMLKLPPHKTHPDVWRRLMIASDKTTDEALAQRSLQWILSAQEKFGKRPDYASYIGDVLMKLKLEDRARDYWSVYADHDPYHHESRECVSRLANQMEGDEKVRFLEKHVAKNTPYHGHFCELLARAHFESQNLDAFEKMLQTAKTRRDEHPFDSFEFSEWTAQSWVDSMRGNREAEAERRRRVYRAVRDLEIVQASASAHLAILQTSDEQRPAMERLLDYQKATRAVGDHSHNWDRLMPYVQAALAEKDYPVAAVLTTGMLSNISRADERRQEAGRDLAAKSYARIGVVGMTIDEDSPLAPLQQAALYLRLGDDRLAWETYTANADLFNEHRDKAPVDLLLFVCENLIGAGGDANHNKVEEILRGWVIKNAESEQIDAETKARVQLMLGRNYFKSQRYDLARGEFTTVINRYAETPQATEAQFGVGETFMAQKVYDQAEQIFEKLAGSQDRNIVARAEFLRGVLFFRRGDHDEARDIFRSVLERAPDISLANQTLFNLAEVYGAEERYIEQLNLLRTVGRLGRVSKRRHAPGSALSIVVQDSDLGVSRGHNRIPVFVHTEPGGDQETIYLVSGGAGKGLFRADLETQLGAAQSGDHVLQLTGKDTIHCDYPAAFKSEFRSAPLSDVQIQVAADAELEVASSKIIDREEETFSERLAREDREQQEQDQRRSQGRPENEIKPGNQIYLRVVDYDRDTSDEVDKVTVKLTADSGDQVEAELLETGPHTGIFEAASPSGELPAGAQATDTAIEHSPLMAIDRDFDSYWLSEPDGAAPKSLTVDLKDLEAVSRVRMSTPDPENQAPVRGDVLGSNDGQFWFRLASRPAPSPVEPLAGGFREMRQRVYSGNHARFSEWRQIVALSENATPIEDEKVDTLQWKLEEDDENAEAPAAVIWQGKFVQPRDGAVRFSVQGVVTALLVDGRLELPVDRGNRTVDVWLTAGSHDLAIFAAANTGQQGVSARRARASLDQDRVVLAPFHADDFDLTRPEATLTSQVDQRLAAGAPITLMAEDAQFSKQTDQFGIHEVGGSMVIGHWQNTGDWAEWKFNATAPGIYEVWIDQSHQGSGGKYAVEFGAQKFEAAVVDTRNWSRFQNRRIGAIKVEAPGAQTLAIRPLEIQGGGLMDVRSLQIKPAVGANVIASSGQWEFFFPPIDLRYVRLDIQEYLGEAVAVNNVEIGGLSPRQLYIPTEADVLALAENNVLEIAAGDTVTAAYTDELTGVASGGSRLLTDTMTATYFNAEVAPISYDFERRPGGVATIRKELLRIEPGERFIVEVADFDADRTAERDTIDLEIVIGENDPVRLTATETDQYTGVFTKEVDTRPLDDPDGKVKATKAGDGEVSAVIPVRRGDRIYCRYLDVQNTFPGHSTPREAVVLVNEPTDGQVRILASQITPPPEDSRTQPRISYFKPDDESEVTAMAFAAPLTVEVIDPDAAKDDHSTVTVQLTTTGGAKVNVECELSSSYTEAPSDQPNYALHAGRFVGQVIMQLGGKDSPALVPITAEMPRGLIGGPVMEEEEGGPRLGASLLTRVMNLTGADVATAVYQDQRRAEGGAKGLSSQGRLVAAGKLACTDRAYEAPVASLHVGEKIFLRVIDPDQDTTESRDTVSIDITTENGEKETVELSETLTHSGVFTGSLTLRAVQAPQADNLSADEPALESWFGDLIEARYADPATDAPPEAPPATVRVPVVVGSNGELAAFTKSFNDEGLAVQTKFHVAESYFELFKSHTKLDRAEEAKADLESGRRVLREILEDYPDPKHIPRVAYLLGQFSQELKHWDEAIKSYEMILRQFPEHTLAADAQYKLAQCQEEAGDFDDALEAYVTLAATYPNSPLISSVMIRICDHFYKKENYEVAAQVGEKFLERFEGHEHASRIAFRIGQCHHKSEDYNKAGEAFDRFVKRFPDDTLAADALFWSGESYRQGRNNQLAFRRYNRCRWDHPASEAAQYARGRLALPEMLNQFEQEANSISDDP